MAALLAKRLMEKKRFGICKLTYRTASPESVSK